jgi:TatD DNase family protein
MRIPLVDYHCHLDLYRDHESAFAAARNSDVEIFAVTTTPLAWERNCKLAAGSANVRIGLGLHPHLVGTPSADVGAFERLAPGARFIGEIGLDAGPKWYKSFDLQREIFANTIRLCVDYPRKVLSIHCVRAHRDLFSVLDKHWSDDAGTLILHWFSGSLSEAKRALEHGCFFSVNSEMIRRPQGIRLIKSLPIERLLTETDGPFIADSGGNAFRPADVHDTVKAIASAKDRSLDEVLSILWRNVQVVETALM